MKKLVILFLMLGFSGLVLAQESISPAKKFHPVSTWNSPKTPTDTLYPAGIVNSTGFTIYNYLSGGINVGYVFGTNNKTKAQAQSFKINQSIFVEEVLFWGGYKYITGTAGDLTVSINQSNGAGTANAGTVNTAPGTQIATTTLSVTDIDTTGFFSFVFFDPAVYVNTDFAIVLDFTAFGDDSLAIVSCTAGDPGTVESAWIKLNSNAWRTVLKNFGANIDMYLVVVTDQSTASIEAPHFLNGMKMSLLPNPAVTNTNIVYELERPSTVTIEVYNSQGKTVMTINETEQSSGIHSLNFNTENLSDGNYYVSLQVNGNRLTKKLIVNR